jgi:EAL domain-containing protein (putative c-di-GMP-specific phosphodiesterase class I)
LSATKNAPASLGAIGVAVQGDFGAGYSSMTYLKRFPVEALKVDRSFVDGLGRETEATAICTAVVSLAHALGMRAVAEGVERHDQLASLRTLGCVGSVTARKVDVVGSPTRSTRRW